MTWNCDLLTLDIWPGDRVSPCSLIIDGHQLNRNIQQSTDDDVSACVQWRQVSKTAEGSISRSSFVLNKHWRTQMSRLLVFKPGLVNEVCGTQMKQPLVSFRWKEKKRATTKLQTPKAQHDHKRGPPSLAMSWCRWCSCCYNTKPCFDEPQLPC